MFTEGMIIAQRYELQNQIGTGGMSVVFQAQDLKLNRTVAVKVMKEVFTADAEQVEKFRKEARAVAMMSHPNIVGVYDIGTEQGLDYMVKEYVDGITLKEYIQRRRHLTCEEIAKITLKIATGLKAAHEQGIIHCDIKPQNILLTTKGEVKITDFGIAKLMKSGAVTEHKEMMGSVHYLSPEQARGAAVDHRSDLYSLGITMFEMAAGHTPYDGDTPVEVALKQINDPLPPIRAEKPELWTGLEAIAIGLTQKNPSQRYQNAADVISDLKRVIKDPSHDGIDAAGTASPEPAPKKSVTIPVLIGVLAALVLALIIVVLISVSSSGQVGLVMPKLTGMTVDEAKKMIATGNYDIVIDETMESVYDETAARGVIVAQQPAFGEKLSGDTIVVRVQVSKGSKEAQKVQKYIGLSYEAAIADLSGRTISYTVETVETEDPNENGKIVRQSPSEGATITDTTVITLTVANLAEEMVEVPDLSERTEAEIRIELQKAHLKLGAVTESYHERIEKGKCVAQSIEAHRKVAEDAFIDVTLSLGAYDDSGEIGGSILLNSHLLGGPKTTSVSVYAEAYVDDAFKTVLDRRVSKEELNQNSLWIDYPARATEIYVYADGSLVYHQYVS